MLDKNTLVITTGSKFFRGPPHTGAVIVPKQIIDRLNKVDKSSFDFPLGLNSFLGKSEFPSELKLFRDAINDN